MSEAQATTRTGRLWLVPAPLDFGMTPQAELCEALPNAVLVVASSLTQWICENARSTRAFLKRVDQTHPLKAPLQQLVMQELPRSVHKQGDHRGQFDARPLLAPALRGEDVGLISEAGLPAVADPGSSIVRAAHDLGIEVRVLAGPSSLLLALAASGLNGQQFAFVGYLPQDNASRAKRLAELEALALRTQQAQVFIETPYRNQALWDAALRSLKPSTRLAFASGLTTEVARTGSASVSTWRGRPCPLDDRIPAIVCLGA